MKLNFLIASILFYSLGFSQGNEEKNKSLSSFLVSAHYGASFAAGDLKDRYSFLNHIGAGVSYKLNSNWIFGLDGSFIFGNKTKITGLFDNLLDGHGNISDVNGDVGIVLANPRGLTFNVHIGKIFPVVKSNPNSGIFIRLSGGYLQHKLNIETRDHIIPSLEKEYRKGYDRFSSGLESEQLLGYLFIGNNEYLNFYAGGFIQEGFTYNRRNLNYDQPTIPVDKGMRLDIMVGIKVAWIFLANASRSNNKYIKQ